MAKARGVLSKLFGPQSMARQFFVWGVAQSIVNAVLSPLITLITTQANTVFQAVPNTPEQLADMVTRGIIRQDWAEGEATKSGVSRENFRLMVQRAGNPPALGDMLSLYRRGKVDRDAVVRAIRQSAVKNEWTDTILQLGIVPPSPVDILDAFLEGQVDESTARDLFARFGGDPEFFTLLYNTRGSAPTPLEAAEMAARGVIPWDGEGPGVVSYRQAFLEGPWRNKWLDAFRVAAEWIPEPRTITAMVNEGSITREKGAQLLRQRHVREDLIEPLLFDASSTKTTKARELTISTIGELYQESAISEEDALGMLQALRYEPDEANFELLSWKLARELRFRNAAIGTVHTQFVGHKIDRNRASLLLDKFLVPSPQRDALLDLWAFEATAKVAVLTPAQIRTAWKRGLFTDQEALERLTNQGYSERDAQIFLEIG